MLLTVLAAWLCRGGYFLSEARSGIKNDFCQVCHTLTHVPCPSHGDLSLFERGAGLNFRKSSGAGTVMEAPVGVIWNLIVIPSGWADFHPLRIRSANPSGHMVSGQKVMCQMRFCFLPVYFEVECTGVDEDRRMLALTVHLPAGILLKEEIECSSLDQDRCMVKSHSDFIYPAGWRGSLSAVFFRQRLKTSYGEWLGMLKDRAKQVHAKAE